MHAYLKGRKIRLGLWVGSILFLAALVALRHTSPASASAMVGHAWQNVKRSDSYAFTASIEDTAIPLASAENIGRFSKTTYLYLEGLNDLRDDRLEMAIWGGEVSVANEEAAYQIRIEDGVIETRVGDEPWQPGSDATSGLVPDGDFMVFLDVAKDIRPSQSATATAVADAPHTSYAVYDFNVDDRAYGERLLRTHRDYLVRSGQLPAGVAIQGTDHLTGMSGSGELWVDTRGLPVRQIVTLNIPPADGADFRSEVKMDIQFTRYEGQLLAATWRQPLQLVAGQFRVLPLPPVGDMALMVGLLALLLVAAAVVAVPNRRTFPFINGTLLLAVVLGPFLQVHTVVASADRIAAYNASQEEKTASSESTSVASLVEEYLAPAGPYTPALTHDEVAALNNGTDDALFAEVVNQLETDVDPGLDSDDDGLPDYVELAVGSSRYAAETDMDGVPDYDEVMGFEMGGRRWYGDPLNPDSSGDGIPDGASWNADSDGDTVPDLYDDDADGDQVPNKVDTSPRSSARNDLGAMTVFSQTNPLDLTINGLEREKYTFVDLQLRPTNPDRLWYAFNVLNWPEDKKGNMQDWDRATFFTHCRATGGANCTMKTEDNGDVKFVPMLEVYMADLSNMPRTPTGAVDQQLLDRYGIGLQPAGNDAWYAYVPLTLVEDPDTGARVAFASQLVYQAGTNWKPQQVRLVWLVQVLNEPYADAEEAKAALNRGRGLGQNNVTVLHVYQDDFNLTGFNVREDWGVDMAIVYEDPAPSLGSPLDGDGLIQMTAGLENTFFLNRDCNFLDNKGECVGDGNRDITIQEIKRRWHHPANSGITLSQRWGIPNYLRVETLSFPHQDAATFVAGGEKAPGILNSHFTPARARTANLLFVREMRMRAMNADAESVGSVVTWQGAALTVDFSQETVLATANYNLAPYRFSTTQQAWEPFPVAEYADSLLEDFRNTDAGLPEGDNNPEMIEATGLLGTVLVVTKVQGQSSVISANAGGQSTLTAAFPPIRFQAPDLSDSSIRNSYTTAIRAPAERVIQLVRVLNYSNANKTMFTVFNHAFGNFNKVQPWGPGSKATSPARQVLLEAYGTGRQLVSRFMVTSIALSMIGVLGFLMMNTSNASARTAGEVITATVGTVGSVMNAQLTIGELSKLVEVGSNTFSSKVSLTAAHSLTSSAAKAAAIGAVIGLVVTWSLFFAAWGKSGIAAGSVEFNNLVAGAVATTIVLVLSFVLALSVIGSIALAVVAVFDLIMLIICKAGVKEVCDLGIMSAVTQLITDAIYQGQGMIDLSGDPAIVNIEDLRMSLTRPEQGLVAGNSVRFTADILTSIRHAYPKPSVVYHYGSFFTGADLQSSTVKYQLADRKFDLKVRPNQSTWTSQGVYDIAHELVPSPVVGWLVPTMKSKQLWAAFRYDTAVSRLYPFSNAQINQSFPLWLVTGMSLPRFDCWFSVCSHKSNQSSNQTDLSDHFVLDVLPATVDGFYWWEQLGQQIDRDNDGLPAGTDGNDIKWDTDGDGLSDWHEAQFRSNPSARDPDGDGLSDAEERRYRTNPNRADSDGDGLSDADEIRGYAVTIGTTTVGTTSHPMRWDTEGDGMSDGLERRLNLLDPARFPFNPRVLNNPPLRLDMEVNDADLVMALAQSFTVTTTVGSTLLEEDDLLISGLFGATLPAELGGASGSRTFTLLPNGSRALVQTGAVGNGNRYVDVNASASGHVYPAGSPLPGGQPDIVISDTLRLTIDKDNPNPATLSLGAFVEPGVDVVIGGKASDPTSYAALVEVSVNGGPFEAANGTDIWAYTLSVPDQPSGTIPVKVRVTDAVGFTSVADFIVTIDSVEPLTNVALAPNETRTVRRNESDRWTLDLSGASTDALAGIQEVEVFIGANRPMTATLTSGGNWDLTYVFDNLAFNSDPQPNEPFTVTVTTRDNALPDGNAVVQEIPFTVDMTPPTVELLSHEDDRVLTDGAVLTGAAEDSYSPVAAVEYAFVSAETVLETGKTHLLLSLNDLPQTRLFRNGASEGQARIYCLEGSCPESGAPGADGTAASFGGDALLLSFDPLFLPQSDMTIALWFNTTCANCGLFSMVEGEFPTIAQHDRDIFLDGGKVCSSILPVGTASETRCSVGDQYHDGQWHQAVYVLGSDGNQLYVDGELVVIGQATASAFTSQDGVIVGHSPAAATPYLTGKLDDVVIYDGALSPPIAASLYRQWQPATLEPGGTPLDVTWSFPVPAELEGVYQIDMRGVDSLGNRTESRGAWPQFRGYVDTRHPTFDLSVSYTGNGSAAQTRYTAEIRDRNLVAKDFSFPACPVDAVRYVYETDRARLGFAEGVLTEQGSLTAISVDCTVPGFESSLVSAYACDAFGHCGSAVPPQNVAYIGTRANALNPYGSLSNAIERANLSDARDRVRLIERPGRIIFDIEVDTTNGKMYWAEGPEVGAQSAGQIWRANLDGSSPQLLHGGQASNLPEMLQIAIDPRGNKLYWTAGYQLYWSNLDGSQRAVVYSVPPDPRIVGGNQQYQGIGDVAVDVANRKLYVAERRNRQRLGTLIFPHSLIVEMGVNGSAPSFVAGVGPGCTYENWNENLGMGVGAGKQPELCLDQTGGMDVEALTVAGDVLYWAAYEAGGVSGAVYGKASGQPQFTVAPLALKDNTRGINYGPVPHLFANPLSGAVFAQYGTQIVRGERDGNNAPGQFTVFTDFLDETPPAAGATTRKSSTLTAMAIVRTGGTLQTRTDLAVEMRSRDLVLLDGDTGSYNLTLRNLSSLPAPDTELTLDLPQGTTFVDATGDGVCSDDSGAVRCSFGRFQPFTTKTTVISFEVAADTVRQLAATATIGSVVADENPANNSARLSNITATPAVGALSGLPYIYYALDSTQLVRIPLFGDMKPEPVQFAGQPSVIYRGMGNALASSPPGDTLYMFDHNVNLVALAPSGASRTVLLDAFPTNDEPGHGRNLAVAVHPETGRIFYTETSSWVWSRIKSANPDGSDVQTINDRVLLPRGLAIDHLRGKLYWIGSDDQMQRDMIYRSNLNGGAAEVVYTAPPGRTLRDLGLDPYAQRLYWLDPTFRGGSIFWADTSGQRVEMLDYGYGGAVRGMVVRPEQDAIYILAGSGLYRLSLDGEEVEELATIPGTRFNTISNLDPSQFFWARTGPADSSLAYVISAPFPSSPCVSADRDEPNDAAESATTIAAGTFTAALCRTTLEATPDIDYYTITVPAGQQLDATLSNLPANYDLQVMQGDGSAGVSANTGLADESLAIPNYTDSSVTYTLIVYSATRSNNNDTYTLQAALGAAPPQTQFTNAQCLAVDPHDQPGAAGNGSQANATPLTVGQTMVGALCYRWDTDFYSFAGKAGQTISVDLADPLPNHSLHVYRPDGAIFRWMGGVMKLDMTGRWAVAVTGVNDEPTRTQYGLRVRDSSCSVNDSHEPNDTPGTAAQLGANRRVAATLCSASDVDYYAVVSHIANQQLTLDYPVNATGAEIKVSNANGNTLGSVLPGAHRTFTLAEAGTYRLEVVNNTMTGDDVAYHFLWDVGAPLSLGEPFLYYGRSSSLGRTALGADHTMTPFLIDGGGAPDYNLVSVPSLGKLYMATRAPRALLSADYNGFNRELLPFDPNPENVVAPVAIAVDDVGGYIFWTQPTGASNSSASVIMRGKLDGTDSPYRFPDLSVFHQGGLAVDTIRGELYFVSDNAIFRRPVSGASAGQETIRAADGQNISFLTLEPLGRHLYWLDTAQGNLMRRSLADNNETALVTGLSNNPHGLVIRREHNELYFTNGDRLYRATLDGSAPIEIATFTNAPYQGPSNLDPNIYLGGESLNPPNSNLVLGYGSPIVSPCTLADPNEPNNGTASATSVTMTTTTTIEAALCYSVTGNAEPDWDYYAVEVPDNKVLTASLTDLPSDYRLVIRHPEGYSAAFSDNPGLDDEQGVIRNVSGQTQTYHVLVGTGSFNMTQSRYRLGLQMSDVPPPPNPNDAQCGRVDEYDSPGGGNGTIGAATPLTLDAAHPAALCYADDVDMYAFDGLAGQQIRIDLPTRPADYTVTLYDPDAQVAHVIDATTTPTYGGPITLPATGRWTVAVSQDNLPPTVEQYSLVVTDESCVTSDPYEPGSSEAAAAAIVNGSRVRASLCGADDVDLFVFTAVAGQQWTLNYPVNNSGAALRVSAAGGGELALVTAGARGVFTTPASGEYFVEVRNETLSQRAVPYLFQLLQGDTATPPAGGPYLYNVNSAHLVRADVGAGRVEPIQLDNGGNAYLLVAADGVRNKLYVRTVSEKIGRVNPDGTGFKVIVPDANPNNLLRDPRSLAVDEQSGRIYWVEPTFGVVGRILSANGDGSDVREIVPQVTRDGGMVVDPVGGYLYWVEETHYQNSIEFLIRRSNLDGSDLATFYVAYGRQIQDLAIDPFSRMLYWLDPTQQSVIRLDADGGDAEPLLALGAPGRGLIVRPHDNTLYFSAGDSLRRADLDGNHVVEIARQTGQYTGVSNLNPEEFFPVWFGAPASNLALAYGSPFAAPCSAVNAYEPNNTVDEAAEIALGETVAALCSADLNSPDEVDYYQVTVDSGKQTTVTLATLPQNYSLFLLANGRGVDWNYAAGLDDKVITHINDSGAPVVYTIGVNRFMGNSTSQTYTLRVEAADAPPPPPPPPPPPDDCAGVDPYDAPGLDGNWNRDRATGIGYNEPVTAALCYPGDKDYYAFDGTIGQNVTFDLSPRPADYFVTLYAPDGRYATGIFPGSFLEYGGKYTLSATGRWTVVVWQHSLVTTLDQYTLQLGFDSTCFGLDPNEPNNDMFDATEILTRTLTLRNILCRGGNESDIDFYSFPLVRGERVRVTPRMLSTGMEISVRQPGNGFYHTTEPIDFVANVDGDLLLGFAVPGSMASRGLENVPYDVDIQIDDAPPPPVTPNNWTCYSAASGPLEAPLGDLATFAFPLNVPQDGTVTHVSLQNVRLTHDWLSDISFGLQAPDGTVESLFDYDDYGFYTWCGGSDCLLSLDDRAQEGLVPPRFPTVGDTYLPTRGSFATFNGKASAGDWKLLVTDDGPSGDTGEGFQYTTGLLKGWELQVCVDNGNPAEEPPPPPPAPVSPEPGDPAPDPGGELQSPPPPPPAACVAATPDEYEEDNTAGSASPFALATLISADHTLHSVDDIDWLAFDAVGGLSYTFAATTAQSRSLVGLSIFVPDGTTLWASSPASASFEPATSGVYYLRASWNGGATTPCDFGYGVTVEIRNPDAVEPGSGPTAPPDSGRAAVSGAIHIPADGTVVTTLDPVAIEAGLAAENGLQAADLLVDGAPVATYTAEPNAVEHAWQESWTPAAAGAYALSLRVTDTGTLTATSPINMLYVDQAAPSVTIAREAITLAKLDDNGLYSLRGTALDDARVRMVEVQIDDGPWQEAVLDGDEWLFLLAPLAQANPNGGTLTITARATDVAGRAATTSVNLVLDVVAPEGFVFEASLTSGDPITPTQIVPALDSRLTWPASIPGSVQVYAGWTDTPTYTLAALTERTGFTRYDRAQAEANARYAHVVALDARGNETAVTIGPFLFDTAVTPDLIGDLDLLEWLASGGKQVGQEFNEQRGVQKLFAGWNEEALRLQWRGINVDDEGDLYFYLGTGGGEGTTALLDPSGAAQAEGLPFTASYAIHVSSSSTATLYTVSNDQWTVVGPAAVSGVGLQTDLLLPFATLGITNPATQTVQLLAVASGEAALNPWATIPGKNLGRPAWTQYIEWASLRSGAVPAGGVWADAPIEAVVVATPDPALPVGVGDTVTVTLVYSNTGTAPLPRLTLSGVTDGGVTLDHTPQSATNIPAGGTGALSLNGTIAAGGTISVTLEDSYHRPYHLGALTFTADDVAPLTVTVDLDYVRPFTNTIFATAQDESPLAWIEAEMANSNTALLREQLATTVTCLPGATDDSFVCDWDAGAVNDGDEYTLRARAADVHGNISAWSARVTATADATPPVVSLSAATEEALGDDALNAREMVLSGTLRDERAAATVQVCVETTTALCGAADVLPDNRWSLPLSGSYNGITGTLTVVGFDGANNPSNLLTRKVWLDTVTPVFSEMVTPATVWTGTGQIVASGTVTETSGLSAVRAVMIMPNGDSVVANGQVNGNRWEVGHTFHQQGVHEAVITLTDRAGNRGVSQVWQFAAQGPAAVTLASFAATPHGAGVTLQWETTSELDNQGFFVRRGTTSDVTLAARLTDDLIPSQAPGSVEGFTYEWTDSEIEAGTTYYYWLEAVDIHGQSTLHGPVSATVQDPSALTLGALSIAGNSGRGAILALSLLGLVALGLVARRRARVASCSLLDLLVRR